MIQKLCTPHNTNAFAMRFAEAILETPGVLDDLIEKFTEGRIYLNSWLDDHGYPHKGEAGNFLFIKPKTDAYTIVAGMKDKKRILIKAYANVGDFGDCLRVSIVKENIWRYLQRLYWNWISKKPYEPSFYRCAVFITVVLRRYRVYD